MKRYYGRLFLALFLFIGLAGSKSCGDEAARKIKSAEEVIGAAREANAPECAPDEFKSAEDNLLLAKQQFDKRRYRAAESSAVQAETQGRIALEKGLACGQGDTTGPVSGSTYDDSGEIAYNVSSLYAETVVEPPPDGALDRGALHDIHFDFDSSELSPQAKAILDLNVQWLKDNPRAKIEIEGHCDERGTDEYNLALGTRRARMVYNYMIEQGVDPSRLNPISFGESVPLDPGHSEEAWAKNRRVHFAVVP